MESFVIPTDNPIESLWNRISFLASVEYVKDFLRKRFPCIDESAIVEKAQGLAFCIKSAKDYFLHGGSNITSVSVNYYYGCFALIGAMMIISDSDVTLDNLESYSVKL